MATEASSSLPNEVPSSSPTKNFQYREVYHLTQLGTVHPSVPLSQLIDENDQENGLGYRAPGPQGFLCYLKEDTLSTPPPPVQVISSNSFEKEDARRVIVSSSARAISSSRPHTEMLVKSPSLDERKKDKESRKSTHTSKSALKDSKKLSKKKHEKKSEHERQARKEEKRRRAQGPPILVNTLSDFPPEAQKLIRKTKISEEKLMANLHVLIHIVRFRTGFNVRTEEEIRQGDGKRRKDDKDGKNNNANDEYALKENGAEADMIDIREDNNTSRKNSNNNNNNNNNIAEKDEEVDSEVLESIVPRVGPEVLVEGDVKKLYKNLQHAGRGGFGSVYLARSSLDKEEIAIKKIPHVTKKSKRTNFNEIGFLTFCKHPNIVKYYRGHLVDDEIWLVMEFMQGGTLSEAVEKYSFAESSVAYVAREMLNALEYLHRNNLVHRDLKSANVMLTVEGKIKLIDFGLCVDHTQRRLCHMAGSPFWMPPEMILSVPHGTPADIWSLAICLLELLLGTPPNRKSPIRAMFLAATEGVTIPDLEKRSPELVDFLSKCLQIDQSKRATSSELLRHPFLLKADTQDTMRKILAQIFISNAISNLDYGL